MAVERGVTSVGFDLNAKGDLYYHDFRKLIAGFDVKNTSAEFHGRRISTDILDFC